MYKLLLIAVIITLGRGAYAPIDWQVETTHDFGDLTLNEPATHEFVFRNNGTDSLLIDNVRTSCGCTAPDWEDVAIPPDSLGVITIEYDAGDQGYFEKKIRVFFNGYRKAEKLLIEGYVEQ